MCMYVSTYLCMYMWLILHSDKLKLPTWSCMQSTSLRIPKQDQSNFKNSVLNWTYNYYDFTLKWPCLRWALPCCDVCEVSTLCWAMFGCCTVNINMVVTESCLLSKHKPLNVYWMFRSERVIYVHQQTYVVRKEQFVDLPKDRLSILNKSGDIMRGEKIITVFVHRSPVGLCRHIKPLHWRGGGGGSML